MMTVTESSRLSEAHDRHGRSSIGWARKDKFGAEWWPRIAESINACRAVTLVPPLADVQGEIKEEQESALMTASASYS